MSICFDLGIRDRVVIKHSLEVGPVGRKMWKEHSLNSLEATKKINTEIILTQTTEEKEIKSRYKF